MIENTISTNENLVQDISNELIFGHTHNGVECAVCPTAKRACDRAWVTAKQIENWSGMSTKTLWRRLNELEECERISRLSDLTNVDIPTETGAVKTTLYNLNVLNQLAMVEMKNKVLNDTAKKFSDILSEVETTGKYEAHPTVPSYMLASEEERAIAWAEEHRQARLALEAKEREIKSLQAQKDVMRQEYKSNKDFCNELIAKGIAVQKNGKPYALSTLRSKMSPILQEVSHTYRYSISEETVVVDGVERKTPYYHRDVCDMIAAVVTPQWLSKPTSDSITPLV